MGIRQFLFACVLGVGGINAASAMDADTQELGSVSMQRVSTDSAVSHDVSGNGGDALGVSRDTTPQTSPASSSSSENCPTGGSSSGAQRSRRISLGWQSLLPGSIQ
ncbi:hypothetical protein SAMN05216570_2406 [Dyella sp. OK004]|uniref:hypothetical protein n=1 Tax=Dyella sp. OK004 TaxID=1855292 RepID=UPI0008F1C10C|nr:hypothetical protein [Dyella sp. OK004]SFS08448.1 hypothetical protein SAMN05216570_2406 [Dyella sp. OK004]